MTGTTADTTDYMWFEERFPDLAEAYRITLVHEVPPAELPRRLGGRAEPARTGFTALVEAAYDFYVPFSGTRTRFGMTPIGSWTFMVEPNGWHGVNEEKALMAKSLNGRSRVTEGHRRRRRRRRP
ncbi:DUF6461 domain-containing protein [Streptomyces sp. NPDC054841]